MPILNEELVAQLMAFYDVKTIEELVLIQHHHIERLQAKLPPTFDTSPRRVREG